MCPSGRLPRPSAASASPDYRPAFDVLDADRDGKISRDDLKSLYSSSFSKIVGPNADGDDVIASMISAADSDRNGFVDFDEFERVLAGGGRARGREVGIMEEAFWVMDRDGDGRVGFEDLKKYLEWAGMGVGDEEVRAMIRMGGGDENDGVGLDGLTKILAVDSVPTSDQGLSKPKPCLQRKKPFISCPRASLVFDQVLGMGVGLSCTVMECGDIIYRDTLPRSNAQTLTAQDAALALATASYLWAAPGVAPGFFDMFALAFLEHLFRLCYQKDDFIVDKKLVEMPSNLFNWFNWFNWTPAAKGGGGGGGGGVRRKERWGQKIDEHTQ